MMDLACNQQRISRIVRWSDRLKSDMRMYDDGSAENGVHGGIEGACREGSNGER